MFDLPGFLERFFNGLERRTQAYLIFGFAIVLGLWLTVENGWWVFLVVPSVLLVLAILTDILVRRFPQKTEETEEATVPIFPAANDGVLRGENDDRPF